MSSLPPGNLTSSSPPADEKLLRHPFLYYFRKDWKLFAAGMVALFLTNSFDAIPPYLIGMAINQIADQAGWRSLGETILLMIAASACLAVCRYWWRIFWGRFHHGVAEDLRNRIFDKFLDLGPSYYQKKPVGELMSLMTNDVNSFRMAIGPGMLILADAIFILMIVPPLMISLSASWTWKTLILMPIIPPLIARVLKLILDNYRKQQNKFAEMSGAAQEIVSGVRIIKSYAQELNQTRLFNSFSRNFEFACNDVARVDAYFTPVMEFGVATGSVILLLIGAPEVMAGTVTVGAFFSFYQYIQRMIWPMTAIGIAFTHIQQGRASFSRILDLLKTSNDVPDEGAAQMNHFDSLEVRGLTFTYPQGEQPILKDLSFAIRAGETIGIVGPIGSGKSTLVDLLCRLYPVPSETIYYNDTPVEQIKKNSLRRLVSLVPQDAFLFSKKIQENIALSRKEWTMDQVKNMCELVNIDDEISDIPDTYDAYLGERGVNLSGGQKQRLTIARALMADSPIVIFDDSLSAVDASTEKNILASLRNRYLADRRKVTVILVSHRIATLKWADRIMVLNDGRLEAFASHEELVNSNATYRQLVELQNEHRSHA
ncbi:MAG: ABC transporter ATP-binding protein [Bdellovibrionales bacterium]|nr:ABC transporter ATP-binding protein [Bdellovibrionales bacterium]